MLMAETVESVSVDSLFTDTLDIAESADTSASVAVTDTLPGPHQVAIDSVDQKKEKTKLVKRTFDSRQQVSLEYIGMMVFIALIMTTAQSWNPKN